MSVHRNLWILHDWEVAYGAKVKSIARPNYFPGSAHFGALNTPTSDPGIVAPGNLCMEEWHSGPERVFHHRDR